VHSVFYLVQQMPARNPFDTDVVCGSSSGGAACAVSAGYSRFGVADDAFGSLRIAAAFTGLYAMKAGGSISYLFFFPSYLVWIFLLAALLSISLSLCSSVALGLGSSTSCFLLFCLLLSVTRSDLSWLRPVVRRSCLLFVDRAYRSSPHSDMVMSHGLLTRSIDDWCYVADALSDASQPFFSTLEPASKMVVASFSLGFFSSSSFWFVFHVFVQLKADSVLLCRLRSFFVLLSCFLEIVGPGVPVGELRPCDHGGLYRPARLHQRSAQL